MDDDDDQGLRHIAKLSGGIFGTLILAFAASWLAGKILGFIGADQLISLVIHSALFFGILFADPVGEWHKAITVRRILFKLGIGAVFWIGDRAANVHVRSGRDSRCYSAAGSRGQGADHRP